MDSDQKQGSKGGLNMSDKTIDQSIPDEPYKPNQAPVAVASESSKQIDPTIPDEPYTAPAPENHGWTLDNIVHNVKEAGQGLLKGAVQLPGQTLDWAKTHATPTELYHSFVDAPTESDVQKFGGGDPNEVKGLKRVGLPFERIFEGSPMEGMVEAAPAIQQQWKSGDQGGAVTKGLSYVVLPKVGEAVVPAVYNRVPYLKPLVETGKGIVKDTAESVAKPVVDAVSSAKEAVRVKPIASPLAESPELVPVPKGPVTAASALGRIKVSPVAPEVPADALGRIPVPDQPITSAEVKSSPGTSMGEPLVPEQKPASPLGEVKVESTPTELTPDNAAKAAESEPRGAAEVHGAVKQRVSELANADLKTLGESFGLNPEEYDFTKREQLREGGSKHPVDRYRFVDDLMARLPDSWAEKFGKLSEDARQRQGLFSNEDLSGPKRAQQARMVFRDRLGIPEATNETRSMSEAELLKHGFTQQDIDAGLHLPGVGGGSAGVVINASGESPASLEAINRIAGQNAQGIKTFRVDTRTGNAVPLFGVDAVDATAKPFEKIVQVKDDQVTELDSGKGARPLNERQLFNQVREPDLVPVRTKTGALGSALDRTGTQTFSSLTNRMLKALEVSDEAKEVISKLQMPDDELQRYIMGSTPGQLEGLRPTTRVADMTSARARGGELAKLGYTPEQILNGEHLPRVSGSLDSKGPLSPNSPKTTPKNVPVERTPDGPFPMKRQLPEGPQTAEQAVEGSAIREKAQNYKRDVIERNEARSQAEKGRQQRAYTPDKTAALEEKVENSPEHEQARERLIREAFLNAAWKENPKSPLEEIPRIPSETPALVRGSYGSAASDNPLFADSKTAADVYRQEQAALSDLKEMADQNYELRTRVLGEDPSTAFKATRQKLGRLKKVIEAEAEAARARIQPEPPGFKR